MNKLIYFDLSIYDDPMEDVLWGEDFEEVEKERIIDQDRWHTYFSQILKYKDGTYWRANWRAGSTEYQECEPDFNLFKVRPQLEFVTTYEAVYND